MYVCMLMCIKFNIVKLWTDCNFSNNEIVHLSQLHNLLFSCPLFYFLFTSFPVQPSHLVSSNRSRKFKQKLPIVELCAMMLVFWPCFSFLYVMFSHPTTFLTSWSVLFLTAVQPLLSDGLFCCLKHLIGGQVYIIRGEFLSLLQSEVLPLLNLVFMDAVKSK